MLQPSEKEQIVQLINLWRERSQLSVKQIIARIQTQGCDINRSMFENRFIRYDQRPMITPELTLAVIGALTKGLAQHERCTAAEAIQLANLTHLPLEQFESISDFFPANEFQTAFNQFAPQNLKKQPVVENDVNGVSKVDSPQRIPLHFPGKPYYRLIGRTQEFDRLWAALHELNRKPIIAVVGLGGIGKTSLVQEVMERCWLENSFDHIVWVSAKTERFVGGGAHPTGVSDYTLERLLDDIGRQSHRLDILNLPPAQKQVAVKEMLRSNRMLVVVDNLETVLNNAQFVEAIFQILGQSKLLITSRHQVIHERVFTLDLRGLSEQEGLIFLRENGAERGIDIVAQAQTADLATIHQVTGGAPLAMRLVVGQVSHLPLEQVLNNLQTARFSGPNYDGTGSTR